MNPAVVVPKVRRIVSRETFVDQVYAELFAWICDLYDGCTDMERLAEHGINYLEAVDHLEVTLQEDRERMTRYVTEAMMEPYSDVTRFVDSEDMARWLRKADMQRQVGNLAKALGDMSRTTVMDQYELMNALRGTMESVEGMGAEEHMVSSDVVVRQTLHDIEARAKRFSEGETAGIPTGLSFLDRILGGGWRDTELTVLAGRPSQGKSALALQFARRAAELGKNVCIYSLEMSKTAVMQRIIQQCCTVDRDAVQTGNLQQWQWSQIESAGEYVASLPIYINESTSMTMADVKAEATRLHSEGRCDLVVIDYLQLLDTMNRNRNSSRERDVAEMSRQAKVMAKELHIPVIVLAQLNREVESRISGTNEEKCPAPALADLRESGAIEQDADVVIFIDRPESYGKTYVKIRGLNSDQPIRTEGLARLTIAKNREGRTGEMAFMQKQGLTHIADFGCEPGAVLAVARPRVVVDPDARIERQQEEEDLPF